MRVATRIQLAVFITVLMVYGTMLLAVVAVAGAAAPAADGGEQHSNEHLHVEATTEDGAVMLTVQYDGPGSATVTVASNDDDYAAAGSYEVPDERTLELPYPAAPSTVEVAVESEHSHVDATVTFEERCGGLLPDRVQYASTTTYDGRSVGRERTVDLGDRVTCERPSDDTEYDADGDRRYTADRDEARDGHVDYPDGDDPRYDRPERADDGSNEGVHDRYNETHDRVIERYERTHERAIAAYERAYDTTVDAYERGHDTAWEMYERVQNGSDGGDDPEAFARDVVEDVENDSDRIRDDVHRDIHRIENDTERFADTVRDDVENDTERIREDVLGDDDDGNESGTPTPPGLPETPTPPGTPEVPETPTPPGTPELPETPEAPGTPEVPTPPSTPEPPETPTPPGTPELPELPGDGDDDGNESGTPTPPGVPETPTPPGTPEIPDTPTPPETPELPEPPGGGDDGESLDASADAEYQRDGSNASVTGAGSISGSAGGHEGNASRSVTVSTSGSTDAPSSPAGTTGDPMSGYERLLTALNER